MNPNFDYPDCKKFTKHVKELFLFTFFGWVALMVFVSWVVANADSIDLFFQKVAKLIMI